MPIRPEVEKILRAKLHAANGMAEAALQAREERMNPPDPGRVMIGQTQEEPYLVNVRSGGTGAKKSESGSVFSQMGVFNVAQVPSSMDTLLESVGLNYITDPAVKAALKGGMVPKRRLVRGGERHGSGAVSFAGVGVSDGGLSRGSGSGDVLKEMEEDRVREHKKLRDKVEASMAMDESIDLLIKQSQAADMPLLPRGRHAEAFKQLMRHMTTHAKKKHVAKARAITGKRRSSIAPTGDGAGAGASEDGDEGDDYSDGSSSS